MNVVSKKCNICLQNVGVEAESESTSKLYLSTVPEQMYLYTDTITMLSLYWCTLSASRCQHTSDRPDTV